VKRRDFIRIGAAAVPGMMWAPAFGQAAPGAQTAAQPDVLSQQFRRAAGVAPQTLWHWVNGCVTREGITHDLEAFRKAGIRDVQQFIIGNTQADISDPEITVLSDKWMGLMRFALDECKRLGMTFGTHNCPGWSASAAPGLLPEDSMQQLVWTKTTVSGKDSLTIRLPQHVPDPRWNFYQDICIIALPAGGDTFARQSMLIWADQLTATHQLKRALPDGEWQVLRFGHTTTGHMNDTAPDSGKGLEVDKMSKEALEKFWTLYPAKLIAMAGEHAGTTFKRLEIDSYEAGAQTWTRKMAAEFANRRGYELLPWLPVIAGLTVENKEQSARFKQDWQQTITDLFAENYFQHLATLINRAGMQFLIQPYGTGAVNFDIGAIRGIGDIPMCEFWWGDTTWGWNSILPVASNSHVNGKRLVAAEAFTGQPQFAWKVSPFDLKGAGDRAFCNGVNLLVLHSSAHQPWPHLQPGMTMGWWGTQFGPSQTWWTHGGPEWIEYLNRCQTLLQAGTFVADLCFLHLSKQKDPAIPRGHKADICNGKELMTRFGVKGGRWVLPDGMHYKLLILPPNCTIDLALAQRIAELVAQGGVVLGNGFKGSPGLAGFPARHDDVRRISDTLFGTASADGKFEKGVRAVGRGRVYTGHEPEGVLQLERIAQDVELPAGVNDVMWIHREDQGRHFYFVANQSNAAKQLRVAFRVAGMTPELWNPETGATFEAPVWEAAEGKTSVTINLEAYGSCFVAFRVKASAAKSGWTAITLDGKPAYPFVGGIANADKPLVLFRETGDYAFFDGEKLKRKHRQTAHPAATSLDSGWELTFQQNRGAPASAYFDRLVSYTERPEPGIRFFSGKARYRKTLSLTKDQLSAGKVLILDLGTVKNVATLLVNGKKVRTFWKPPFVADIGVFCTPGNNTLEVEVTNLWPNRMIGDEHEPEDAVWGQDRYFKYVTPNPKIGRNLQVVPGWVRNKTPRPSKNRITFNTMDFFDKDDPLLPSGLLGPVVLTVEDTLA
jgi:hypothetical protein